MSGYESKPIGHQYALAMITGGEQHVRTIGELAGSQSTMDAFLKVQGEDPVPSFLHSAMCAMSLPVQKPKDEMAPILRMDGKYALAINPRPVLQSGKDGSEIRSLGVPYGSYPRVALIYMLSQAVKSKSRDVYLGRNFTDWMRRLGYQTVSYGPRGSATMMRNQVDRLLACEWQVRWDGESDDDNIFAVKDVKLSNEYSGSFSKGGGFTREIRLSETFYNHLVDHAVPLNERAISTLKSMPTALDLYTYLAYRLPRIETERVIISWGQLASHLGNEGDTRRFRQTIRRVWEMVSSVYPNANVDLTGQKVILKPSKNPLEQKLIGPHLRLVGSSAKSAPSSSAQVSTERQVKKGRPPKVEQELVSFPSGSLKYGKEGEPFYEIAKDKGHPWCADMMADEFRKWGQIDTPRSREDWLRAWERFVISYAERRRNSGS